jgi:CRISPR/Cas system endoribonuclease Cas6 (RAMP superfamily)
MSFDGLIGTITINDIDINSFELLSLAELIGIGKQTSFGLGKVVVTKA